MSANQRIPEDNDTENPGTSASVNDIEAFSRTRAQVPEQRMQQVESNQGSTSSVKARNVSRDRPVQESGESKRIKVSDDDDEDNEDVEEREDILRQVSQEAMETDSSDEEGLADNEPMNYDRDISEPDSHPQPFHEQGESNVEVPKIQSRRSSTADQDVSTTMQSSSLRYKKMFPSEEQRESTFVLDQAVASTSAAAMAPPLSKIIEESPALNEVYRQSALSGSVGNIVGPRRSIDRSSPPTNLVERRLNFQRGENVDVNENRGTEEFLQKMHGKQRLLWARKLFFVSTELVFPGFTAYSDNRNKMADYLGVRVRSSCAMQALLYADSLFFVMWILSFLSTCQILVTVLKQLHGYLSICLTCLFIIVNIIRLRFGLKGNENDEVQYLALFWMITVIVQIPLFTFIFLTDLFCPVLMAFTVTMDGAMIIFILLESIVGFIHFRSLLRDELNIIKMAKRSKEARSSNAPQQRQDDQAGTSSPLESAPPFEAKNIADPNESESSNTDSEMDHDRTTRAAQESMDFRMQIRRLSESQRTRHENQDDSASDSSEQVTSTSDNIRQRPIRVH